jgi:hypothetical protein
MHSNQSDMDELRRQIEKGSIQRAYRALLAAMTGLRAHFTNQYGAAAVSALYQGYLDMTYFAVFPPALKPHDLKAAVVFNYDAFRFEIWLAARNRKIQRQTWELFKNSQWPEYQVVAPASGVDAIVEYDLTRAFDFADPDALNVKIDGAVTAFIADMQRFLSEQQPAAA